MSPEDSLKINPFWVASSDDEEDDVNEDENNNDESEEAVIRSRSTSQKVINPLQVIAFAYGSSDDDDQFIEGSGEEKEPVEISNNSREESAAPLVHNGKRNENDDSNADDEGDDHSFMTISTPEDSSEDACDEYDSDESESDNEEKYHDLVPVTRSRYAAMPMLPNLARDRDCVLKISKERFVVIKDFEGGVVEISSSDEDEEVIKHGRLDANARSNKYFKNLPSRSSNANVRSQSTLNLSKCDPKCLKMVKKCQVRVRRLPAKEVKEVSLEKTFTSVTDIESESGITRSDESKFCVAGFAQEILAKLEGVKIDELKMEPLETNLDVKADSGEERETAVNPLWCGRISVADSKSLFKESLSLQSYSISSSGLGVGWDDSDSDDDVVILEESFAGPVPGLEFQVLGVGMSVEGNEHEDLLKIFESQDNNGDITSERKSIDAKEEGVVKMRQPIIDDPNIEETIECKKSILMVKEYGFDERSKSSISTSYESQMKVGDQNVGIANVSTPKKIKKCDGNGWFQPKLNEKKLAKDSADGKEAWKVKVVVDNEKYKPSVKDVYKEKKKSPYKNIEQEAVHKLSIGDVFKTSFSFKIPKTKCKKDPGKVAKVTELGDRKSDIVSLNGHSISIKTFLEQEEIVPEVRLESSYEGVGRDQFDTMYERVISIKNSTKKNIPEVDDDVEKEDIDNEGWDALKKMQTDAERNSWVQAQFQNTIPSDPGRNLTVHGFRRQTGQNTALRSANLSVQTDQVLPSGVKRNIRDDDESEVEPKKIKLSDFGSFMKSVFFMKFNKNIGSRKVLTSDLEAFKTYLGHFKGGLEETSNFLSYYNPRKELDEVQVEEVVDLENQFSTFRNYYGEAEDLFCKQCEKRHKFCQ